VDIAVLAHETWFTSARPPYDWSFTWTAPSLLLIAGAVGIAAAWRAASRRIPRPELPFLAPLGRLWPWVPRLLAVHAGVSLLAQAARGTFLAPSLELPSDALGASVRIAEGVLGVWLVSGFRVRGAAFAVAVAGPIGMAAYGVVPILERLDLLGIAVFLALVPPGADAWGSSRARPVDLAPALAALRILVGASLIVLAFSEKLARPALALAFLERFPAFNLMRTLGMPISDVAFVRVTGAIELLFGLLLVSGALPQLVVIVAGVPFNATLFFLGTDELIGHLPLYGAMLALLVYGSSRETAGMVDRFPWRRRPRPSGRRSAPWRPGDHVPDAAEVRT
jgi:uncharacterized membrane protein YphA (DoxX/SURF4 family)